MDDDRPVIEVRRASALGYSLTVRYRNFDLRWSLSRQDSLHLGRSLLREPDVVPPDRNISTYQRGDVVFVYWGYAGHPGGKSPDAAARLLLRPDDARWLGEVFLERVKENDRGEDGPCFSRRVAFVDDSLR